MPACRISATLPLSSPLIYGCLSLAPTLPPAPLPLQQMVSSYLLREKMVPIWLLKYNKKEVYGEADFKLFVMWENRISAPVFCDQVWYWSYLLDESDWLPSYLDDFPLQYVDNLDHCEMTCNCIFIKQIITSITAAFPWYHLWLLTV